MLRVLFNYSRIAIPLMLGVCIGIGLSFVILPLLEGGNCQYDSNDAGVTISKLKGSNKSNEEREYLVGLDIDSFRSSEFEPKVVKIKQSESQLIQKPARHRFIKAEVDMKETVHVSYLTSKDQISHRATALARTITSKSEVTGVTFFANLETSMQHDLPLIPFNYLERDSRRLLFHAIKYVANNIASLPLYKYFTFLPDTTFINARVLRDILAGAKDENYIGFSEIKSLVPKCDLSVGIILSLGTLKMLVQRIDKCEHLFNNKTEGFLALDQCIKQELGPNCMTLLPTHQSYHIKHVRMKDLADVSYLEEASAVSDAQTARDIINIRRHTAQMELRDTTYRIDMLAQQVKAIYPAETVPLVPKAFPTSNRYDILRWTLISDNLTYLAYDYENMQQIKDTANKDLMDMVAAALRHIDGNSQRFQLVKLLDAYTRLDPTRGQDYIISLQLYDQNMRAYITKEFEVVKPRTDFFITSLLPKAEEIPLHIIVPFIGDFTDVEFLVTSYTPIFRDQPLTFLHVLLANSNDRGVVNMITDQRRDIIVNIENYLVRTGMTEKVNFVLYDKEPAVTFDLISYAISLLPEDVIVFISNKNTILNSASVSRIRDNTVKGRKVYAPIAFWEYMPSLVYENRTRPHDVEVSRNIGHFGELWFDHISIFSSDYKEAYKNKDSFKLPIDMIAATSNLEIMRAVDPDVHVRNSPPGCNHKALADQPKCGQQWLDSIGSSSILAKKLIQDRNIV